MYTIRASFSDAYNKILEDIKLQILKEPDSTIIGTTTEELADYYYSNKHYDPVKIDLERTETLEQKNEVRIIRADQREDSYRDEGDLPYEYESIHVTIPIVHNAHLSALLNMRPSTFSLGGSTKAVNWKRNTAEFTIDIKGYAFNRDDTWVINEVQRLKQYVYNHIHIIETEVTTENAMLLQKIKALIEGRKTKLTADKEKYNSLFKQIGIPIKKKDDDVVKRIQLDTQPLVQKVKPNPTQPENYSIKREDVLAIIHILDNQGSQFEKTPASFENSGENDFRNILLVGLNTVFQGKATGETFNAKGKSDIYLNIAKGNILVCECKIWGGQKLYGETIDQLLGYLTWRENYGIMITFVKNKSLTNVLTEADTAINAHPSYRKGFQKISASHFLSHHVLPSDEFKFVELHHLFYNI
ncbi:hypothetical protein [uncultured Mucilaginibacter sp.]|uniref:hypothetical protein n=1 Tax=uncultured Mucilaginibacter sp. TaxID=797541 RepID=UPI0025E6085D|nr:hypothetical protein [uncultured Mucilaginibacter sp.]